MSQLNIVEMKQARAKIVDEMRKLQDAIDDKGSEDTTETEKFGKMERDIRALEVRIEREEKLQDAEASLAINEVDKRKNGNGHGLDKWDGIVYPKIGQREVTPQ